MSDLILTLDQKQTLSQKTIQNIEILQMSAQELESYLTDITLENPVIDQEPVTPNSDMISSSSENYSDFKVKKSNDYSENSNSFEQLLSTPDNSLSEHIIFQLIPFFHDERDKSIFHYLVESLDDHGFLTIHSDDLCKVFKISSDRANEYVSILQSVDPPGIGAFNLSECLILQLKRSNDPSATLAISILTQYIDKIANNQVKDLSHIMNVGVNEVSSALTLIKSLNPRPANGFCCSELATYIQPDVIIMQKHNNFQITINGDLIPGLKINNSYRQLLNHPDKEVREYLYQKFQQAEWINKCLEQRNTTLLKITQQLLSYQKAFFLKGPHYLKPLNQSELGAYLELNDSTISRAIHDKYLECFWGVFPFKYFFSKAAPNTNSDMTVKQLKLLIKSLIEKEDKKHPLSDQKIVDTLSQSGMFVARRTIAKYRSEMLIPDTSKRRIL